MMDLSEIGGIEGSADDYRMASAVLRRAKHRGDFAAQELQDWLDAELAIESARQDEIEAVASLTSRQDLSIAA